MARILIIDDNELVRDVLYDLLEEEGHETLLASDGREGLKMLAGFDADIVITDILMPGQEGIETIQQLRAKRSQVKIIAISGGGSRFGVNFLDIAEKMGADATLSKPIDASELAKTVQRLVQPTAGAEPTQVRQAG